MKNGLPFHVAAVLRRAGQIVRIGVNSFKTHPKFMRTYPDGSNAAHMHAEMDVLRFAEPGDELEVMRFRKCGEFGMAKPCKYCMQHILESGVRKVKYTDESGVWKTIKIK
jgi:deoxycytidylate deaminase